MGVGWPGRTLDFLKGQHDGQWRMSQKRWLSEVHKCGKERQGKYAAEVEGTTVRYAGRSWVLEASCKSLDKLLPPGSDFPCDVEAKIDVGDDEPKHDEEVECCGFGGRSQR